LDSLSINSQSTGGLLSGGGHPLPENSNLDAVIPGSEGEKKKYGRGEKKSLAPGHLSLSPRERKEGGRTGGMMSPAEKKGGRDRSSSGKRKVLQKKKSKRREKHPQKGKLAEGRAVLGEGS